MGNSSSHGVVHRVSRTEVNKIPVLRMARDSSKYLAAKLLGGYPRGPSVPGAHIHDGAFVGSGVTVAAGEAPREQLLGGQSVGLRHHWNSFQLGVFPLEHGVQTHAEVLVSPCLRRSSGVCDIRHGE